MCVQDETKGGFMAQAISEYASESSQEADNLFAEFASHGNEEVPDFCS